MRIVESILAFVSLVGCAALVGVEQAGRRALAYARAGWHLMMEQFWMGVYHFCRHESGSRFFEGVVTVVAVVAVVLVGCVGVICILGFFGLLLFWPVVFAWFFDHAQGWPLVGAMLINLVWLWLVVSSGKEQ